MALARCGIVEVTCPNIIGVEIFGMGRVGYG